MRCHSPLRQLRRRSTSPPAGRNTRVARSRRRAFRLRSTWMAVHRTRRRRRAVQSRLVWTAAIPPSIPLFGIQASPAATTHSASISTACRMSVKTTSPHNTSRRWRRLRRTAWYLTLCRAPQPMVGSLWAPFECPLAAPVCPAINRHPPCSWIWATMPQALRVGRQGRPRGMAHHLHRPPIADPTRSTISASTRQSLRRLAEIRSRRAFCPPSPRASPPVCCR
mmetsp:Transcript_27669/g.76553  ORF Transcript_27669/g.76553 Transcript_27669/m.76553 type:complete len:223 (-) Transcript_27669:175-843(-)